MMSRPEYPPELRRKNVRLALWVLVIVILMFITAVPFWVGLFELATGLR